MALMSFKHLKKGAVSQPTHPPPIQDIPKVRLQRLAGIGVMKSALLASVNYCAPCPMFWESDESEKKMGAPYGRCCRESATEDNGWMEVWQSIPLTARVTRCWYHMQIKTQPEGKP